jgi:hypothetical protein
VTLMAMVIQENEGIEDTAYRFSWNGVDEETTPWILGPLDADRNEVGRYNDNNVLLWVSNKYWLHII